MPNHFARIAPPSLPADPLIPATAARRVATRLALLGFTVPPTALSGKPLSEVVRSVVGGSHRTSAMLVAQALRDELTRR